jgi:hypothetical protein
MGLAAHKPSQDALWSSAVGGEFHRHTEPNLPLGLGTIEISKVQADQFDRALRRVTPPIGMHYQEFFLEARDTCRKILTEQQLAALSSLHNRPSRIVGLAIYGLPFDVPEDLDPSAGLRPEGLGWQNDGLQLGLLGQVWMPISYPDENRGVILAEIATANPTVPSPRRSQQSQRLEPHSDRSRYSEALQPDVIALAGFRNTGVDPTYFAPVASILERVPEALRPKLFEPVFDFRKASRFRGDWRPILKWSDNDLWVSLPPEELPSADDRALEAQRAFRAAVPESGVAVMPGTMLFLLNRCCLHWRNALNSSRRWLRRAYGVAPAKYDLLSRECLIDQKSFVAYGD